MYRIGKDAVSREKGRETAPFASLETISDKIITKKIQRSFWGFTQSGFTQSSQIISTHLLTVLTMRVILHTEQRKREKASGSVKDDNKTWKCSQYKEE